MLRGSARGGLAYKRLRQKGYEQGIKTATGEAIARIDNLIRLVDIDGLGRDAIQCSSAKSCSSVLLPRRTVPTTFNPRFKNSPVAPALPLVAKGQKSNEGRTCASQFPRSAVRALSAAVNQRCRTRVGRPGRSLG